MREVVHGTVRGTGRPYANGLEPLEIWVPLNQADGLPYVLNQPVPITLRVLGGQYETKLRSRSRNKYVWISPTVYSQNGERRTLAEVLVEAGFAKNEKILLGVDSGTVSVLKLGVDSDAKCRPSREALDQHRRASGLA